MKSPVVSLLVPNLNSKIGVLDQFLTSVKKQKLPASEVLIIDNGSNPQKLNKISRQYKYVKIIALPSNLGFAKAINIGASQARGNYLFITNSDVILDSDCLKILYEYAVNNILIGILGPNSYLDKKYHRLDSGTMIYSLTSGLFSTQKHTASRNSFWISGSGLFIAKELFKRVNGFDENFFFYYEDIDLAMRVRALGFSVKCIPDAKMIHFRGTTAHQKQNHFFRYYHLHKSRQLLLIKHGDPLQIITGLFLELFVFSLYHILLLRDRSVVPMFIATKDNLKNSLMLLTARKKYQQWLQAHRTISA